jgi:hypothetical protein
LGLHINLRTNIWYNAEDQLHKFPLLFQGGVAGHAISEAGGNFGLEIPLLNTQLWKNYCLKKNP